MNHKKIKHLKQVILALLLCPLSALAEANQAWPYIRDNYIEAKTETQWNRGLEYLRSLTFQELLIAARHCGKEIEEKFDRQWWPRVADALTFFNDYYKLKKDFPSSDLKVLLLEISNEEQSVAWRGQLAEWVFSDWLKKLKMEEIVKVLPEIKKILADNGIDPYIKQNIVFECPILLNHFKVLLDNSREQQDLYMGELSTISHNLIRVNMDLLAPENPSRLNLTIIGALLRFQEYNLPGNEYIKSGLLKKMVELDKFSEEFHQPLKDAAESFGVKEVEVVPKEAESTQTKETE